MAVPQTVEDARAQGYEVKKLSRDEAKRLIERHDFNAGVKPLWKRRRDCSTIPPNGLCWEGDCILGQKEVLYCDNAQGCTLYAKVRC
jgi:hypothetical protein